MKQCILLVILAMSLQSVHAIITKKHYIVYMGEHSLPSSDAVVAANLALLAPVIGSDHEAKQAAVHHYSRSFRGFSARLDPQQARLFRKSNEVISVFESRMNDVHTTQSWSFLGVDVPGNGHGAALKLGSDVILGIIDTGVWPESESFNDSGLGPMPKRFRGECVTGQNFSLANCNRKIIGARYYYKGFEAETGLEKHGGIFFRSARDSDGHGSHTASTVAGSMTSNIRFLGMSLGNARGGAVGARIAVYKACWFDKCSDADILAAYDDAVADGVDIISVSAGPKPPQPNFFSDAFSIGAFHAFSRGILVSCSAGNQGYSGTVTNTAPWILTVAASSIDRKFNAYLKLGNSKVLRGTSLNTHGLDGSYGIISASAAAAAGVAAKNASFCNANNTLSPALVAGKIVVCTVDEILEDRTQKAEVVRQAGGLGMVLVDPVAVDIAWEFVIPSALIGAAEAAILIAYLSSEKNPVASISATAAIFGKKPAPIMAAFSSKGPSPVAPDIIKPDVTAPGMNILAAWSPVAVTSTANQPAMYAAVSGSSMACPHVSGAAAIIKSYRPHWSPAAIRSALMTTAKMVDNELSPIRSYPDNSPATPFGYGSGHIDPIAAINPGLVYDMSTKDIINFLCSGNATSGNIRNVTGEAMSCSQFVPSYNLNYPSIGVANLSGPMSVRRTVTNVQQGCWVYSAYIESPPGVIVRVVPEMLIFSKVGEKKAFRLDLIPEKVSTGGSYNFGYITWSDGTHRVRSPIAVNIVSVSNKR